MRVTMTLTGLTSAEGRVKVAEIGEAPFTIGRSPAADWTLEDATNTVSGLHLELRESGGALLVTDTSSGGTGLDAPKAKLQKGRPTRLPPRATLHLPNGGILVEMVPEQPRAGASASPFGDRADDAERDDIFGVRERSRRGAQRASPSFGGGAFGGAEGPETGAPGLGPRSGFAPSKPPRLSRDEPTEARRGPSFADILKGGDDPKGEDDAPPFAPAQQGDPAEPETPPKAPQGLRDPFSGPQTQSSPTSSESGRAAEPPRSAPPGLGSPGRAPSGFGSSAPGAPAHQPDEAGLQYPAAVEPAPPIAPTPGPTATAAPPSAAPVSADPALDAMLRKLGFAPETMTEERRRAVVEAVGTTYAAMADALRQLLIGRDTVKRELGLARTEVQFGANPLKFSLTRQAAIDALLDPKLEGYLTGEDAVEDALEAMQLHQMALVGAIRAATRIALDAFDPDAIEAKLEKGGLSQVVPALRRAELWEKFRQDYKRFVDQADDDIRMVIGRELDKLYAQEANRPRRGERR
jgi:type VI secretion system FHA domain protein